MKVSVDLHNGSRHIVDDVVSQEYQYLENIGHAFLLFFNDSGDTLLSVAIGDVMAVTYNYD